MSARSAEGFAFSAQKEGHLCAALPGMRTLAHAHSRHTLKAERSRQGGYYVTNPSWLKALFEACLHAHHPALHYQSEEEIVKRFLWYWEEYPSPLPPPWEQFVDPGREYEGRSAQNIFAIVQRAVAEGDEEDRVFALFLLGSLATPKARDLLISFLESPYRKERWASVISLGRLKDERVFALLQTLLLEGFFPSEIFANGEELQRAQEACRLYRQTLKQGQPELPQVYWPILEQLKSSDYEWFLRQRSECALILGAWGNPVVIPKLSEAMQAAWKMEQDWPDYEGTDESGPEIWYFFQDHLAFALGQCGAWDALSACSFPENHLLVARIYLILGALQVNNPSIFYERDISGILLDTPLYLQIMAFNEDEEGDVDPYVDREQVKWLLGEHFHLSPVQQEEYTVWRLPQAWYERATESGFTPAPRRWRENGPVEPDEDLFDPFAEASE